jgi:hypothetical protein
MVVLHHSLCKPSQPEELQLLRRVTVAAAAPLLARQHKKAAWPMASYAAAPAR